jgi:predicted P-loop ATPase
MLSMSAASLQISDTNNLRSTPAVAPFNLEAVTVYRGAGFACHWLYPRSKTPIGEGWSDGPIATLEHLRASYRPGNNLGVRLGQPSQLTDGGYLHVLDIDIRVPSECPAAWAAVRAALPGVDLDSLPMVRSGSGGASRHLYFVTDKPFRSHKLAHSGVYFKDATGKHLTWEVELFGSGKQVAMPGSIHPVTGKPYVWEREFEFDLLTLGIAPTIDSLVIEQALPEDPFEPQEGVNGPCEDLDDESVRGWLSKLSDDRWSSYESWYQIGAALHHQYTGGQRGLDIYEEVSATKPNYKAGETRKKWKSFGKNRRVRPVTMRGIMEWAKEDMRADQFDEVEDEPASDEFEGLLGAAPVAANDDDIEAALSGALANPGSSKLEWVSLLDITEEGAVKPTLHNIELIVRNDARTATVARFNEFTRETVQRGEPGRKLARAKAAKPSKQLTGPIWRLKDPVNGDLWTDEKDNAIRAAFEAPKTQGGYGIKISDRDLKAAIDVVARDNSFHPVCEFLSALKWDGVPRLESLFVRYLGAPDTPYVRAVARLMMIGAVTRVFEPGAKFDFAVILEGLQGKRKSTFIKILARHWFAELDGDFHDPKAMVELMQGAWLLEMPELSGFGRADVRKIKSFISSTTDKVRLAYARRAQEYPRQCIFIGSTNDADYLRDDTGGRRFWPVACTVDSIDTDRLRAEVDLLWAEAYTMYRIMRNDQPHGTLPLYLADDEAREEAELLQESRRVESAEDVLAGRIGAWLDTPILDGSIDGDDAPKLRTVTCGLQIHQECLGKPGAPNSSEAQVIGRALRLVPGWQSTGARREHPDPKYGRQRLFKRVSAA